MAILRNIRPGRAAAAIGAGRALIALGLIAAALAGAGCYNNNTGETGVLGFMRFKLPAFPETGGHSVVVFSEMHYSPAYRVQEIPRILPPEGSIPIGGPDPTLAAPAEIALTAEEYAALTQPSEYAESYDPARAAEVYRVNCMVCHGAGLRGDGVMKEYLTRGAVPADMMGDIAMNATEGELFAWISYGSRTAFTLAMAGQPNPTAMPDFRSLLSEADRWHLVSYILGLQGR